MSSQNPQTKSATSAHPTRANSDCLLLLLLLGRPAGVALGAQTTDMKYFSLDISLPPPLSSPLAHVDTNRKAQLAREILRELGHASYSRDQSDSDVRADNRNSCAHTCARTHTHMFTWIYTKYERARVQIEVALEFNANERIDRIQAHHGCKS